MIDKINIILYFIHDAHKVNWVNYLFFWEGGAFFLLGAFQFAQDQIFYHRSVQYRKSNYAMKLKISKVDNVCWNGPF